MTHKEQIQNLVFKFRKWLSDNYSKEDIEQNLYDDAGYPLWIEIENHFAHLLTSKELCLLDKEDKINLLYLIARNWDIGSMINWLSKEKQLSNLGYLEPVAFIDLVTILADLNHPEFDDAKLQFVTALKKFDHLTPEIEQLLLKFYDDKNIDIKGRSLLALAKFGYSKTRALLEKLWQIDDEFNKIKCLSLIDEYLKDRDLMLAYLSTVVTNNREHLHQYVQRLKRKYHL